MIRFPTYATCGVVNGCASVLVDGNLTTEHFLKRNKRLGSGQSEALQTVVDDAEQVVVVTGKNLHENVILAGSVVALDNLGNFFKLLDYLVEARRITKEKSHVCTSLISNRDRVDD